MNSDKPKNALFNWRAVFESPNLLPVSIKMAIFLAFPVVTFFQDFVQVFSLALSDPEAQYVLLVPFVVAYFFYRRRKAFLIPRKSSRLNDLTGAGLCLLALLVYVSGSYSFYSLQYHLVALPIFLAGLILLVFGADSLKLLIFPVCLLVFLSPLPLIFMDAYGGGLMSSDATVAGLILKPFLPISVTYQPIVVLTSLTTSGQQIQFSLNAACSGIYSLTAFLFCAVVFGYLAVGSATKKIFYGSLAVLAAYLLNVFRITIMVVLGHFFGLGLAVNFFHEIGGTALAFIGTLILLYFGSKVLRLSFTEAKANVCSFCKESKENICTKCGRILRWPKTKVDWKRLVFVLIFLLFCSDLIAQAAAVNYNPITGGSQSAVNFNPSTGALGAFGNLTGWSSTFNGRETSAEQQLGLIYVGDYSLTQTNSSNIVNAIFEVSDLQAKFHTWEGCLYYQSYPLKIQNIDDVIVYSHGSTIVSGEIIDANAPTLNQTLVLVYWFDSLTLKTNTTTTDYPVKITLYKFIATQNDSAVQAANVQAVSNQLFAISQSLENTWSPYKNSNYTFAVNIYQDSTAIAVALTGLLSFCVVALTVKQLMLRRAAKKKTAELPSEDKRMLEALRSKRKEDSDGTRQEENGVEGKLEQLRQEQLIHERIVARNNELYQEWVPY